MLHSIKSGDKKELNERLPRTNLAVGSQSPTSLSSLKSLTGSSSALTPDRKHAMVNFEEARMALEVVLAFIAKERRSTYDSYLCEEETYIMTRLMTKLSG